MASTTVTILVSVRTMLDRSHVTVREVIQGTEYCVEVKLFFLFRIFPFLVLHAWSGSSWPISLMFSALES